MPLNPTTLCSMFWELIEAFDCRPRREVRTRVVWFGAAFTPTGKEPAKMAEGKGKVGQLIPIIEKWYDAKGRAVDLPDEPVIQFSDDSIATLVIYNDALHIKLLKEGAVLVELTQDADPGPGVEVIKLAGTIVVDDPSNNAVTGSIEFGAAFDEPPAPAGSDDASPVPTSPPEPPEGEPTQPADPVPPVVDHEPPTVEPAPIPPADPAPVEPVPADVPTTVEPAPVEPAQPTPAEPEPVPATPAEPTFDPTAVNVVDGGVPPATATEEPTSAPEPQIPPASAAPPAEQPVDPAIFRTNTSEA